jgi:hypothetical protein
MQNAGISSGRGVVTSLLALAALAAAGCTINETNSNNNNRESVTNEASGGEAPAVRHKSKAHAKSEPASDAQNAEAEPPAPEKPASKADAKPKKPASKPEVAASSPQAPEPTRASWSASQPSQAGSAAPAVSTVSSRSMAPGVAPVGGAPTANLAPATPPPPQPEQSQIVLPVKIALEALEQQIDALVPQEDKKDWTPVTKPGESPKADVKVQIWRDPVKVTFSDHTFHITVPVRYAADIRAQLKNPLGGGWIWIAKDETWGTRQEPQHLTATFDAALDVDEAWHVKADLRVVDLKHGEPPSGKICKNAGVELCVSRADVAPQVNDRIDEYVRPRLRKALSQLEAKVDNAFALQAHAQSVWKAMQAPQPLQVPGAKEPAWLVVQPSAIGLGKPDIDGSDVRIDLSIAGRIAVQGGGKPKTKPSPLPKLSTQSAAPGFHVLAELDVPDAALSASLDRVLKGVRVGRGKKELTVTGAQVVAHADPKHPHHITIKVSLGGGVQEDVELSGDLVFDPATLRLSVENFNYASEAEAELAKKLAGYDHEAIRKQIAAHASWDLGAEAAPLKKAITEGLNGSAGNQVHVGGDLDALDVREFAMNSEALTAQVIVGGTLEVSYTPK